MSKYEALGRGIIEGHDLIGRFDTPEQAARIVKLLNEGEADKRRLDWLGYTSHGFVRGTDVSRWSIAAPTEGIRTLREAIDAAIAAAPASKEQ